MQNEVPKILFVEEDSTLAEVTAFRLELLGYAVETAASGEEAVEKSRRTYRTWSSSIWCRLR